METSTLGVYQSVFSQEIRATKSLRGPWSLFWELEQVQLWEEL